MKPFEQLRIGLLVFTIFILLNSKPLSIGVFIGGVLSAVVVAMFCQPNVRLPKYFNSKKDKKKLKNYE